MTEQRERPATNAAKRRAVDAVLIGSEGNRFSTWQAAAWTGVSHHLVHIRRERAMAQ